MPIVFVFLIRRTNSQMQEANYFFSSFLLQNSFGIYAVHETPIQRSADRSPSRGSYKATHTVFFKNKLCKFTLKDPINKNYILNIFIISMFVLQYYVVATPPAPPTCTVQFAEWISSISTGLYFKIFFWQISTYQIVDKDICNICQNKYIFCMSKHLPKCPQ